MLAGKVAVITGGAEGLGLAIAEAYATEGAAVLLVARRPAALDAAQQQLRGLPGQCATLALDVTTPQAGEHITQAALQHFGSWDTLVNCAGIFVWKKALDLSFDDWQKTLDTNLTAPYRLSECLARHLIQQARGGSIINIGSIHGTIGDGNAVPQCAAKFGLLGLTKALAEAFRDNQIRVNAIVPGAIEATSSGRLSLSGAQLVTQGDVAQLAVYLASDRARFITGATIDAFGLTRPIIANA